MVVVSAGGDDRCTSTSKRVRDVHQEQEWLVHRGPPIAGSSTVSAKKLGHPFCNGYRQMVF